MPSITDICNAALIKVGENTISSLTDGSKGATLCSLSYDRQRRALLRLHNWNFALGRVALPLLATVPSYEFSSEFQLPTDYLRIIEIDSPLSKFKIEGGKLLYDSSAVSILYVKDITDTTLFDDLFVEALACKLALEITEALVKSRSLFQDLFQVFNKVMEEAKSVDGQETNVEQWDIIGFDTSRITGNAFPGARSF